MQASHLVILVLAFGAVRMQFILSQLCSNLSSHARKMENVRAQIDLQFEGMVSLPASIATVTVGRATSQRSMSFRNIVWSVKSRVGCNENRL